MLEPPFALRGALAPLALAWAPGGCAVAVPQLHHFAHEGHLSIAVNRFEDCLRAVLARG